MSRGNMAQSVITLLNMDCKYVREESLAVPVTFILATWSTDDMFGDSPSRLVTLNTDCKYVREGSLAVPVTFILATRSTDVMF